MRYDANYRKYPETLPLPDVLDLITVSSTFDLSSIILPLSRLNTQFFSVSHATLFSSLCIVNPNSYTNGQTPPGSHNNTPLFSGNLLHGSGGRVPDAVSNGLRGQEVPERVQGGSHPRKRLQGEGSQRVVQGVDQVVERSSLIRQR